jgi:hypothetical protein
MYRGQVLKHCSFHRSKVFPALFQDLHTEETRLKLAGVEMTDSKISRNTSWGSRSAISKKGKKKSKASQKPLSSEQTPTEIRTIPPYQEKRGFWEG